MKTTTSNRLRPMFRANLATSLLLSTAALGCTTESATGMSLHQLTLDLPGNALFDSSLGVPKCTGPVTSCATAYRFDDTDPNNIIVEGLHSGRNSVETGGYFITPELNSPNTIDSCPDGDVGDESLEWIRVVSADGSSTIAAGGVIDIEVGVKPTADDPFWNDNNLDLWYTTDVLSPAGKWTRILEDTPSVKGNEYGYLLVDGPGITTLRYENLQLPEGGGYYALRGIWAFGKNHPSTDCDTHEGFNTDHDDLVFYVQPRVMLNEILANEPDGSTGREFVEIVNVDSAAVDISGWTVADGLKVRHTFAAGTVLGAGQAYVVYASAYAIPAGASNAVAASTGALGLNNGGDTVTLSTSADVAMEAFTYDSTLSGTDGVSMNRSPDAAPGSSFALHTAVSPLGTASSAGTRVDGSAF